MNRIVVAANAEADQPWVAEATAHLAKQTGASVAVLSVDDLETEALSTLPRQEVRKYAERAAETTADRLERAGIEVTKDVRSGPAVENILDFAEEQDASLIVVGSSARSRLAERVLGSVPLELVQRSRRPVLIVSPPPAEG